MFANAAAGDFHQVAGSPTINAGADDPLNGVTDLEGKPRLFGAHTDIGADEYAPPSILDESVSSITLSSAVVSGDVNTEGGAGLARIDYGTTTGYGSSAAANALALSTSPQAVSAAIGGLQPATTYHYRLVVANGSGTTAGSDQTFTTPSGPAAQPPATQKKCKKKHRRKHARSARKHCKHKKKR
jgi:hypothetical protein